MGTPEDAALGLPLVMTGSDSTARLNEMIGTKPGQQPSRTGAASLSETQARREACCVVESAALTALLNSGLNRNQLLLVKAYTNSVYETRKADLDIQHAKQIALESEILRIGGAA